MIKTHIFDDKVKKNSCFKPFWCIFLVLALLCISPVSAIDWDDGLEFEESGDYGKLHIEDLWGLGDRIITYELLENTDFCIDKCYSLGKATLYEEGTLFEDFDFHNIYGTENNLNYQVSILKDYDVLVDDYSEECNNDGNQTICHIVKSGSHTETKQRYEIYNYETLPIGNYSWKLESKEPLIMSVDWGFKNRGINTDEIRDYWAWWNNSFEFKRVSDNNYTGASTLINFPILLNGSSGVNLGNGTNYIFSHSILNGTTYLYYNDGTMEIAVSNGSENAQLPHEVSYGNDSSTANFQEIWQHNDIVLALHSDDSGNVTFDSARGQGAIVIAGSTIFNSSVVKLGTGSVSFAGDSATGRFRYTDNAYDFSGQDEYSFVGWIRQQSGGDSLSQRLWQVDGSVGLAIQPPGTGELTTSADCGNFQTTNVFAVEDTWFHLGYVCNTTGTYFWKNGVFIEQDLGARTITSATTLRIATESSGNRNFAGNMDEIWFTNDSLTPDEIKAHYNLTSASVLGAEQENINVISGLLSPIDFFNTTLLEVNFTVNSTAIKTTLSSVALYIWNSTDDQIEYNLTTITGVSNQTNYTITLPRDDTYKWNALVNNTGNTLTDWDTNRTFTIDATEPLINVTFPRGTLEYHLTTNNITLNWTVGDSNLESCWFEYAGTNTSVTCGDNNYSFFQTSQRNLTFYANDTFGNLGSNFTSWNFKIFENSQNLSNQTISGSTETFIANITLESGLTVSSATLFYGNQSDSGQVFIIGDDTILRETDFIVPVVSSPTVFNVTWEVTLSDSSVINLTQQNQTVFTLSVDNCTTNTVKLFNFSMVDEELQTALTNTTLEIAVNIFSLDQTTLVVNYSEIITDTNPVEICINNNITGDSQLSLDLIAKYEAINYVIEYYNIVNSTLTNDTELQNIILYDLLLNDSTDFQVTFKGSDFVAVEGALINLQRQYISENQFKTVELPLTDSNGQTVLHLVRNDIIYNIEVLKDGVVLGTFSNIIAFCEDFTIGDCSINLNAFSDPSEIFDYENVTGLIFQNPTYDNSTRIISFNFLTNDGTVKQVDLNVTRNDIFGNNDVCNNTVSSSGATLTCSVPSTIDDSALNIEIFVNGELSIKDTVILESSGLGVQGYYIFFIYMLAFVLMFSDSKTGLLIGILIGFISGIVLGLINGKMTGLGASGIWLIIVIILMLHKLNKRRPN